MPKSKTRKKKSQKRRSGAPPPPPIESKTKGPSPKWYVATMFGLMAVGVVVILLNYIGTVPGGTSNVYLLSGLGAIAVGFVMTLGYE